MENINKEIICHICLNCKCNQIIQVDKIKKIKICKICNITENDAIFPKNRNICNKCRYKNKNIAQEQAYFKEYYIKNKEKLLQKQADTYKRNKILNLIV